MSLRSRTNGENGEANQEIESVEAHIIELPLTQVHNECTHPSPRRGRSTDEEIQPSVYVCAQALGYTTKRGTDYFGESAKTDF